MTQAPPPPFSRAPGLALHAVALLAPLSALAALARPELGGFRERWIAGGIALVYFVVAGGQIVLQRVRSKPLDPNQARLTNAAILASTGAVASSLFHGMPLVAIALAWTGATGLMAVALQDRRRVAWLLRVYRGEVPGWSVTPSTDPAPRFAPGVDGGGRLVTDSGSPVRAVSYRDTAFRAVARVPVESGSVLPGASLKSRILGLLALPLVVSFAQGADIVGRMVVEATTSRGSGEHFTCRSVSDPPSERHGEKQWRPSAADRTTALFYCSSALGGSAIVGYDRLTGRVLRGGGLFTRLLHPTADDAVADAVLVTPALARTGLAGADPLLDGVTGVRFEGPLLRFDVGLVAHAGKEARGGSARWTEWTVDMNTGAMSSRALDEAPLRN